MKIVSKTRLFSAITLTATSLFFTSCGEKKDAEAGASTEAQEAEASAAAQQAEDTLDSLTDELIVQLNEYAGAVLSVSDKATAEAAVAKLTTIGDEIEAIAARLEKIEVPDEATNIAVDEKMTKAGKEIQQKMQAASQIMSDNEIASIMIPALQKFGMRMAEQEKTFRRFGKQGSEEPAPEQAQQAAPASEEAAPAAAEAPAPAAEQAPAAE
jgi:hypothetical protein